MQSRLKPLIAALGIAGVLATMHIVPAEAREYRFHVSCPNKALVVEWGIGAIDPGKEYLRVTTGTHYPGCSISDYNEARDKDLPKERHSDAGGVIKGIPLIGPILKGIFG